VRVAVLDDEPEHAIGVCEREGVGDRRAKVVHVEHVTVEAELLRQGIDRARHGVEGVLVVIGGLGEAEPGQVGCDHSCDLGEWADDIPEAVRRARLAVQQQHSRAIVPTGLTEEHLHPINVDRPMLGPHHVEHVSSFAIPAFRRVGSVSTVTGNAKRRRPEGRRRFAERG
jgi:hypothetical protein